MKTSCIKRMGLIVATLAMALLAGGCVIHEHGNGYHRVYGPVVRIEATHVHTPECGHYYYRGHWYHAQGHVHGPGCGHVFRSGIWVTVR